MLIQSLITVGNKRGKLELEAIMNYLKKLPLFEDEINDLKGERNLYHILNSLALNIRYQKCAKGDIVIEYESTGNTFYIIIKGSVTVFIPEKKTPMNSKVQK